MLCDFCNTSPGFSEDVIVNSSFSSGSRLRKSLSGFVKFINHTGLELIGTFRLWVLSNQHFSTLFIFAFFFSCNFIPLSESSALCGVNLNRNKI